MRPSLHTNAGAEALHRRIGRKAHDVRDARVPALRARDGTEPDGRQDPARAHAAAPVSDASLHGLRAPRQRRASLRLRRVRHDVAVEGGVATCDHGGRSHVSASPRCVRAARHAVDREADVARARGLRRDRRARASNAVASVSKPAPALVQVERGVLPGRPRCSPGANASVGSGHTPPWHRGRRRGRRVGHAFRQAAAAIYSREVAIGPRHRSRCSLHIDARRRRLTSLRAVIARPQTARIRRR